MKSAIARLLGLCCVVLAPCITFAAPQEVTFLMPAPPNLPGFAPWIIAQQKGYYAEQGLKVTLLAAKGGADVAKQVGAGNAMFGAANGDTPLIVRDNGVPVKAVAVLGQHGYTMLATDAAAGITRLQQLKGKTISVMSYSDSLYYTLLASLRQAGMSKSDVSIQAAGPAGVWQLFASGKADAMAGAPDWVVNAAESGKQLQLLPDDQLFASMAQSILASDDAIAHHPDQVRAMVRGTLMGLRDIIQDPSAAAKVFAAAVPGYEGKEQKVEDIFALYISHVYGQQAHLGEIYPERVSKAQSFYLSEGIIRHRGDINSYFTNEFIPTDLPLGGS
ncbi:nitrate ABC transporter substrate-binding protein [Pokkaliibacter plantistimulans]|uniref:Nitrate ABC transporter substrate-binding protein n=1 Tax=Proteobacteria bacterium 228 TaxID=2083153 RepID=A0A2S5KVQ8_9PROT|nr:ABC transporter substrate-binding protein [Pokkaliibacter plantistimulans]PPC78850.1 nitrate ABC transporter substrate-binding protein [Pokkaliibacter plantistimulans]